MSVFSPILLCGFMRLKYFWDTVLLQIYNLGTGNGYSVFQMVKAVEKASGRKVSGPHCTSSVQRTHVVFAGLLQNRTPPGWRRSVVLC